MADTFAEGSACFTNVSLNQRTQNKTGHFNITENSHCGQQLVLVMLRILSPEGILSGQTSTLNSPQGYSHMT